MSQSVASVVDQPERSNSTTEGRWPLVQRVRSIYLICITLLSTVFVGVAGVMLSAQPNDTLWRSALAVGIAALIVALLGSISAWRGLDQLALLTLPIWALIVVGSGTWLLPQYGTLWLAATLLPVVLAVLLFDWHATALIAILSVALFWGLTMLLGPAPDAATQHQWLLLSGVVGVLALLIISLTIVLTKSQIYVQRQHQALEAATRVSAQERSRLKRISLQWLLERDRLAAVLSSAPNGIVLTNAQGDIITANPAARLLLKDWLHEEIEGHNIEEWQRDAPGVYRVISDTRTSDQRQTLLEQINGPRRIIGLQSVPIRSTSGDIIGQVGLFHNRTEELELDQMRSHFLELLVKDMHDPLTSILAAHDALHAQDLPEGSDRVLTTTRRATTRLLDMVNTLLEMSRLQHDPNILHRMSNPLRPLIESSVAQATPLAQQRSINLVMEYGAEGGAMMFDADKMRRVMLSLLDNALKHSPAYSTIRVQASQSSTTAQVRITDQGAGIPHEYAERIFERFGQVAGDQRSAGLGLAFCKMVIEAHGGQIWVESTPGKGSTFALSLPTT